MDPALIWLTLGASLVIIELFAPGTLLLWFGLAALITAALTWLTPISISLQFVIMAVFSIISVFIGKMVYKKIGYATDSSKPLNSRMENYIGMITHNEGPISEGRGRIKIEDTSWMCQCAIDLPDHTKVKVIGANGTILIVEPVHPQVNDSNTQATTFKVVI